MHDNPQNNEPGITPEDDPTRHDISPEEFAPDGDVPFHIPLAEGVESTNIHKDDTEDIPLPDETTNRKPATQQDDAQPEDERPGRTVPNPAMQDDDDVPFKLSQHNPATSSNAPVPSKWVTIPHNAAKTLPGSGGLDPNPDFVIPQSGQAQTIPSQGGRGNVNYQQLQRPMPIPHPPYPANIPPPPQGPTGKRRKRRRGRNIGCVAIMLGLLLTFCGGLTLVSVAAASIAYARVGDLLNKRIDEVEQYASFQSTFMYDRNGKQLFEIFNEGRRQSVSIEQMPQPLIDATIAIEDDTFFRNIGVDIAATTVALLNFIGASEDEQTAGGSTITQQLVRNVLFDPEYRAERSAQRKAEEILLAVALTGRKGKYEILELYLNEIYYGNLAYGAQAASKVFFDKDVSELALGEAALLAGLPQAPAELDPLSPDPEVQDAVDQRWRLVLNEMLEETFITQDEYNQALKDGLTFKPQEVPLEAPHFTVFAQTELERLLTEMGLSVEEISRGGFQVYTSVDLPLNTRIQQIAAEQVVSLADNNASNASIVVLKPITGEILAMVGSIDYNNDFIDGRVNVTTALRQPGSTMKPFTYAAAMERGFSSGNVIWDTRIRIPQPGQNDYVPRNYDGGFHGPMRMRYALANSYNIPAVQVMRYVEVDYLLEFMARLGVISLGADSSRYGLSLTLGGGEISPLELTRAYSVLANDGLLIDSQAILCILDNEKHIIYQYEDGCPRGQANDETVVRAALGERVLDERIAFIISDILSDNITRSTEMGSQSALYTPDILTSAKTGTTNDVKDNWTMGYTRNVAIGVWVGNNNGDPMHNVSGLTSAAPIWNRVMNEIYGNTRFLDEFAFDGRLLPDRRNPPVGLTFRSLCDVRQLYDPVNVGVGCSSRENEWLLDGSAGIPDNQGGIIYPEAINVQPQLPQSGSFVEEVEPGIYSTKVLPIAPQVAAGIQFNVSSGEPQPPPPKYCRLPVEYWQAPPAGSSDQLFIAPPPHPEDAVEAENYALNNGLAFLPTIDCNDTLINTSGGGYNNTVVGAIISPAQGAAISPPVAILGTASFPEDGKAYYKIDLLGGSCCPDWKTIGPVHYQPVVNGPLDTLPLLEPGSYQIRLEIIGPDGNRAMEPYVVGLNVP